MEIKRSINVQFIPNNHKELDELFDKEGSLIQHSLIHIKKLCDKYSEIEAEEGTCYLCQNNKKMLVKGNNDWEKEHEKAEQDLFEPGLF